MFGDMAECKKKKMKLRLEVKMREGGRVGSCHTEGRQDRPSKQQNLTGTCACTLYIPRGKGDTLPGTKNARKNGNNCCYFGASWAVCKSTTRHVPSMCGRGRGSFEVFSIRNGTPTIFNSDTAGIEVPVTSCQT